jgi:rRNA maturation protein Nop10
MMNVRYLTLLTLFLIASCNYESGSKSSGLIKNHKVVEEETPSTPTVSIDSPNIINIANEASYSLSGSCSENGTAVDISIGGTNLTPSPNCSGGSWSKNFDASFLSDSASINVTADHSTATQATQTAEKDTSAPSVGSNSIAASTYTTGQTIAVSVVFDQTVIVSGNPRIALSFDTEASSPVYATYDSGSTTNTLIFNYVVTAGDDDPNGIALNASIDLNSGSIQDVNGNNSALNLATTSFASVLIDTSIPSVTIDAPTNILASNVSSYTLSGSCTENGVAVTVNIGGTNLTPSPNCTGGAWSKNFDASFLTDNASIAITADHDTATQATDNVLKDVDVPDVGSNTITAKTYIVDDVLTIDVVFDQNVIVGGSPRIRVNMDTEFASPINAGYDSGSTTNTLSFKYTVVAGDEDLNGVSLNASIDLNSGSIQDTNGNPAVLTLDATNFASVLVDTSDPEVTIDAPSPILAANVSSYTLSGTCTEEGVDVAVNIGGTNLTPNPSCSSGTWSKNFDASFLTDNASIAITADHDTATQATSSVLKDVDVPDVSSNSIAASTYSIGQDIVIDVQFDQDINVSGAPRIELDFNTQASDPLYADYDSKPASDTLRFIYTVQGGDDDSDGIALVANIDLNTGSITDANTNPATLGLATTSFGSVIVDSQAPTVTSIIEPANATYAENGELLFQVNYNEAVNITGSPRIVLDIGGTTRYAVYQSGTGTAGLEFSYTIVAGENDGDGISVTSTNIDLNSGTIKAVSDSDNAGLNFAPHLDSLASVLVDTSSGVTPPDQVTGLNTAPTTSNTELSATWSVPNDNGTAITHYVVQYREQGESTWNTVSPNPTSNLTNISGLTAGITYEIRVAANNGLLGAYSAVDTAEIFDLTSLNLALWMDASDINSLYQDSACTTPVTSNNDPVGCWEDKAGFGRDFIQATAGNRPTYKSSAINGMGGLDFDGAGDFLADDDGELYVNGFQAFEFFVVVQSDVTNTDKGILDTKDPNGADDGITLRYDKAGASGGCSQCMKGGIERTDGSHVQGEAGNNTQTTSVQLLGATWADGGKYEIYINGSLNMSWDNGTLSGTIGNAQKFIIGKGPKDGGNNGWDGKIVEVVFLNTQTNASDRAKLVNYLKTRWNIP